MPNLITKLLVAGTLLTAFTACSEPAPFCHDCDDTHPATERAEVADITAHHKPLDAQAIRPVVQKPMSSGKQVKK